MPRGVVAEERDNLRPRFVVPLIAAAFLATLTIWVLASPGPTARAEAHGRAMSPPAKKSPADRTAPNAATTPSVAPSAPSQGIPDSAPSGVIWQIVDTVALPFSDSAGPIRVTDGIPAGFAHTPTGALLAMVQIDFRHLIQPNFVAVTAADVADTPGRAEFFHLVQVGGLTNPTNPQPGTYLQLAGFEFVSYTSSTAVIQLLTARLDGSYQISTLTVAWDGTDWQLVLQADGTDSPNQQIVASPVGFVLWGGV